MQNIFKSTFRHFTRKPVTNLINLLGLSTSLVLVIILSIYCYSELTTDNFQKKSDRLFIFGQLEEHLYMPGILKEQIDMHIPAVESTVQVTGSWETPVFQVENIEPISSDLIYADADFFTLFTYHAVEGNLEKALKTPMTVVITESLSKKLFGKEQAVGKTLKLNNKNLLTIAAVVKEPEQNSALSITAVTSMATRKIIEPNEGEFTEWGYNNFQTFVLLKKGADPVATGKSILNLFPEKKRNYLAGSGLTPFKKIYFSKFNLFGSNYLRNGDKAKITILLMVAVMVLFIALINFVNISSAQWYDKVKQTGVMKVIGAKRSSIIKMILVEAFLLFFAALIIAGLVISFITPLIQRYTGIYFNPLIIYSPEFILISMLSVLVLSVLFSLIPALRISSSRAVDNLKKTVAPRKIAFSFRGLLVASQFTIAIVLIAFTVLVQKQVNYGSSNLGFNQKSIIGIKLTPQLNEKKDVLKKTLSDQPSIVRVSLSQYYPGKQLSVWGTKFDLNGESKEANFTTFSADASFLKLMGLHVIQGRFYSDSILTDKRKIVVNETFLRENKITDPIGGKFSMSAEGEKYEIVGVVKDFHFETVNKPIAPLAIRNESASSYCMVELQSSDFNSLRTSINQIKTAASELSPSFPVEVSFYDQAIENLYQTELKFRRTFSLFAGCAIVICCLGILAMSLFACQRRIKEIGIRKINGAKVSEVMVLLNIDFVKWVAIAFVIATPISWYVMNKWLEGFAYKTELSWWIFALAGLLALGIALLTVSWQSWKAATRNPVEALRTE